MELWRIKMYLATTPSSSATQNIRSSLRGALGIQGIETPADFFNLLLPILFTLGGIGLFLMLIWGGFEMMANAADSKAQQAGKQRITAAIIGFVLLFVSYWIAQTLEIIFGIRILG